MAKPTRKTVTIKLHKNGSMTLKSTGGVDLRKVVPSLFQGFDEPDKASRAEAVMEPSTDD